MGDILEALRQTDQLDNTVILFASDHGDHLGDHNLIGKSDFFESSIHVPLIVRDPQAASTQVCETMVELGDVTATLLHYAGCPIPESMDSIPLPALGIDSNRPRPYSIGVTSGGWMIYDGRWKLVKYATGECLLFDIESDPEEQINLLKDSDYWEKFRELDTHLTQSIMAAMTASHADKRVYAEESLSSDPAFGKRGWLRRYPQTISGTT